MVKTKYLTFSSSKQLENFLSRKLSPKIEDKIEFCVMEKFPVNRILFTAEHAMVKKLSKPEFGEYAYIGIGDKNTGILAKLAAYYLRAAYLIPLFLRTEADPSRPIEELGKGLRLFVKIFYSKKQATTFIPIHSNLSFLPYLEKFHLLIEQLNPKAIISIHGIHAKRKFDILFGFGENYSAIGGKKKAFNFKDEFSDFLDKIFSQAGIENNLKLAVSTWLFTGSRNYVLNRHVIEHNKKSEEKRVGIQVELNWKGRVGEEEIPTLPYQITIQALGDFVFKHLQNFS